MCEEHSLNVIIRFYVFSSELLLNVEIISPAFVESVTVTVDCEKHFSFMILREIIHPKIKKEDFLSSESHDFHSLSEHKEIILY